MEEREISMLDATGKELFEDDFVVLSRSSGAGLEIGYITSFTKHKAKINVLGTSYVTRTGMNEVVSAIRPCNYSLLVYPHQICFFDERGTEWERLYSRN